MYTFLDLKNFLDEILEKYNIPGHCCKVFHKGKEVFSYNGGYADRENNVLMTGNEYFFVYSMSKVLTCATALHAYEQGAFSLGDPVWWYLPEFKNCSVKRYDSSGNIILEKPQKPITVQNLFTMTAGLNYDLQNPEIQNFLKENKNATTREIVRCIAKIPLEFEPGEDWNYSLCHDVLACLVEAATGKRFSEYMRDEILVPLEMKNTTFRFTEKIKEKMAQQYQRNCETKEVKLCGKTNGYVFSSEYDSGGAGIITTIDDYSKFVRAMSLGGIGTNGQRILSPSTVKLMKTNLLSEKNLEKFQEWDTNYEYGYGFGVRTKIGECKAGSLCSIGEFGWGGAAGGFCSIDTDREIGIVYLQHVLGPIHGLIDPKITLKAILALGY